MFGALCLKRSKAAIFEKVLVLRHKSNYTSYRISNEIHLALHEIRIDKEIDQ
jgi:hypothetical protein